jgi:carbonic anhydrase
VRKQVETIRNYPFLIPGTDVHGFIYDVRTGKLEEVGEDEVRVASLSS